MKSKIVTLIKYLFFLSIGIFIFWYIYRKYDVHEIIKAFKEVNYWWIAVSLVFSVLSIVSRAMRWQLLINSIGYKPRFANVFLSCYVLYLVNLFVPRAGEVARCSVVSSTDKVPFAKLVGTMIIERLADVIMLGVLAILIFAFNWETIKIIADKYPLLEETFYSLFTIKSLVIILAIMFGAFFAVRYLIRYRRKKRNLNVNKKESLWIKFLEGVDSISRLNKKWQFIGHTAFIFLMWLGMLYVVFLAYAPTAHLSIRAGMLTFLMGGLAMLVPVQGGIGPWHAMVSLTLENGYGIAEKQSEIFAFIAHTTTNLVYVVLGAIALIVVFAINSGKVSLSSKKAN
jgi:glycosyltransferase 2 family protein